MHSHTIVSLLSIWALMFVSQVSVNWGDSWSMALHPFHFQSQHPPVQPHVFVCATKIHPSSSIFSSLSSLLPPNPCSSFLLFPWCCFVFYVNWKTPLLSSPLQFKPVISVSLASWGARKGALLPSPSPVHLLLLSLSLSLKKVLVMWWHPEKLQHIQILIGACRSQSVDNQGSMYLWWSWQWADKKGLWKTLTPPTARSGFSIDPVKKRRLQEYMAEFKSSLSNVTESQSFVSAMFSPTAWKVASSKSFLIHWVWPVL